MIIQSEANETLEQSLSFCKVEPWRVDPLDTSVRIVLYYTSV